MKNIKKILFCAVIMILALFTNVEAHNKNVTGYNEKNSNAIVQNNGKYYGYHNENGKRHYHQVEWNEENQKWKIVNPAVYYDENFNRINIYNEDEKERIQVTYYASVDGDTAKFKLNDKIITVRFLGINTPETLSTTKGEEPYGKEASNYTKEKLENANKIEIEYDKNASEKDKYDRYLAWIWIDDNLLQEGLVLNGLAETYMLQNNYRYAGILQLAEEKAKENKIGIWSRNVIVTENNGGNNLDTLENEEQNYNVIYCIVTLLLLFILVLIGYKGKVAKNKKVIIGKKYKKLI